MKIPFLSRYYLFSLLSSTDFIRGLHLVYILEIGFGNTTAGVLQAILFLSSAIFEIPFGYLADRYNKQYSITLGTVFFVLSALIYLLSSEFLFISFLYLFQGLGFAFYSGSLQAMLYDNTVVMDGNDQNFHIYLSRSRLISSLTLVVSIFIGSQLYKFGWHILFLVYLFFQLLAFITSFFLSDIEKKIENDENLSESSDSITFVNGMRSIFRNKKLILFTFGLAFLEAAHTPFFMFYQNYLYARNVSPTEISIIISITLLFSVFCYLLVPLVKKVSLGAKLVWVYSLCLIIALAHSLDIPVGILVILFIIYNTLPLILFVFTDEYINQLAEDSFRTTTISFVSLINSIFIAVTYLGLGGLYDKFGFKHACYLIIFLILISAILMALNKEVFSETDKT